MLCLHPEVRSALEQNLILFVLWSQSQVPYDARSIEFISEERMKLLQSRELETLKELKIRAACLQAKHERLNKSASAA